MNRIDVAWQILAAAGAIGTALTGDWVTCALIGFFGLLHQRVCLIDWERKRIRADLDELRNELSGGR